MLQKKGGRRMIRHSDKALAFMAKWPEPGRTKTRLSPAIPPAVAADLARCFLLDSLDEARRSDADRWIAFAPAARAAEFAELAGPETGLLPADTTNFGVALAHTQRSLFEMGYRAVALVASDVPHLPAERYTVAFAVAANGGVAVGPCRDGGYYLLAARQPTPHLFHAVAWSTKTVFATTLRRANEAGLNVSTIPACDDVDTPDDLDPLFESLSARLGAGRSLAALKRLGIGR